MARFDVDAAGTTYHPSRIEWLQPERVRRHDGSSTRSAYWFANLQFTSQGGEVLAAAFEEWEAFDDGGTHSIVLPPPNNVLGSDATYSDLFIEVIQWPPFVSVNVGQFTVLVGPVEFTS